MQSWNVFHFARKHLGRALLYSFFGKKNARAIDYWCEDPRYTNKPDEAYDPIKGVKQLLEALDDQGHCGVVRAAIAYLVSGTSIGCAADRPDLVEPLPTIHQEILADYAAVAELQRAIGSAAPLSTITACKREAIAEIERTVAKYMEETR